MSSPLFSIITCTLNSVDWIDESIRSVLCQRHVTIDYVFVDGGSTDGTLDKLRAIPREITLIENHRNGISDAMNAGVAAARGDIVAHLHSDDYYLHPEVLSSVAHRFGSSGCRWLFGRTARAINGQLLPESYTAPRYSRQQLLNGNFIPHPATFVERSLLNECGLFDTRLRYAMDYDLWLRLSAIADPLQLDDALTAFREHAGSLSTRDRIAAMKEDLAVRLVHTGPRPLRRLMHHARYMVRRRRAQRSLSENQNTELRNPEQTSHRSLNNA
jgi:glycosyltransferase involved in cell wall biosynthesis